jgi:hypothetical protein
MDNEAKRSNTEALLFELVSASTKIDVSTPFIIVHYRLCSILTFPFWSEVN